MRRHLVLASLSLLAIGALAGCGQKGPLFLPPTKPPIAAPAAAPAPATSAAKPATPVLAVPPPATTSGM